MMSCNKPQPAQNPVVSASPAVWPTDQAPDVLAFGSCSHQYDEQKMWPAVLQNQPDCWIWLGDIVYADTDDMAKMREIYDQQKNEPNYQKILQKAQILGIWDDHDYGLNDGGKEFAARAESKKELFRFLDVPADNPAWQREGAYQAYEYGPAGKQLKVILIDSRYFRDPLEKDPTGMERYRANPEGDMLGDTQWQWLESEIAQSDASLYLIGTGVQIIPQEQVYEKWDNFPKARQRFLDLLTKFPNKRFLLLTGDRHIAEVSKIQLPDGQYPVYEFTSSGLTHTWDDSTATEPNRYRSGPLVVRKNFGVIRLDWAAQPVGVTLEIRGEGNQLFHAEQME